MKAIPIMKWRDMKESLAFYTGVLDFGLKDPGSSPEDWVIDIVNG